MTRYVLPSYLILSHSWSTKEVHGSFFWQFFLAVFCVVFLGFPPIPKLEPAHDRSKKSALIKNSTAPGHRARCLSLLKSACRHENEFSSLLASSVFLLMGQGMVTQKFYFREVP